MADDDIPDIPVLIGLAIFYSVFTVHCAMHMRPALVRMSSGILVKAKDLETKHATPFLYDPMTLKHRVRSYSDFVKRVGLPPPPNCSFQVPYSTSRRATMYRLLHKGALVKCLRFSMHCGAFAVALSWLNRASAPLAARLGSDAIFDQYLVRANLKAAKQVQIILLPLASFILALYINMKLEWFNGIINLMWDLQGNLNDTSLLVATSVSPPNDRVAMAVNYRMYRYLNVVHFLCYHNLATDYHADTIEDIFLCGLLTKEEKMLLHQSSNKKGSLLVWIGSSFRQLAQAGKISEQVHVELLSLLQKHRGFGEKLQKEMGRVVPISYAQLVQLMTDMLMLLTPPALADTLSAAKEGYSLYLWPVLGSMLLACFYQGCMRLVTSLEYPLGSDLDDVRPDWLLMSSERTIWALLTEVIPEQLTHGPLVTTDAK